MLAALFSMFLVACDPADATGAIDDKTGTDAYGAYLLCANYIIEDRLKNSDISKEKAVRDALDECRSAREAYIPYLIQELEKQIGRSLTQDESAYVIRKFDTDAQNEWLEAVVIVHGDR